ncbi:hypothetical protein EV702DRAFT_141101 [Suillus placidus]|uniref:Uncharacterized protein n=1 Tax=Suillus placidus TaxID=48579 RepID=A0A9P7D4J8_9AGAM|nr:hypothetical protein EV702DRAFT_141101 [Suillus placidus]
MHFVALFALAVAASTVPGLAAPTPNSQLQATSERDSDSIIYNPETSPGKVVGSVTTKRDDDIIFHNIYPYEISSLLVAGVVQGTGSNNTQGIASDTKRRSDSVHINHINSPDNTRRQTETAVNPLYDLEETSDNHTKRQAIPESATDFYPIY